jgi:hypothetical protein
MAFEKFLKDLTEKVVLLPTDIFLRGNDEAAMPTEAEVLLSCFIIIRCFRQLLPPTACIRKYKLLATY